ncbi:MAG: winged helix-turn-helix domain-containing protein [Candidatus Obscuribacterales bacterium]|nr:winged helix-turn-helix domain-containing protein [Candidatus Obscuribacterales bacterium]
MLEFLMRNAEHVFNVDALMSRVWKSDESCSIDSVRMCIARLRKKLRGIPGCPQLETQHGAGYTLTMSARIKHKHSDSMPDS